mgnify:CR=1 FL=1
MLLANKAFKANAPVKGARPRAAKLFPLAGSVPPGLIIENTAMIDTHLYDLDDLTEDEDANGPRYQNDVLLDAVRIPNSTLALIPFCQFFPSVRTSTPAMLRVASVPNPATSHQMGKFIDAYDSSSSDSDSAGDEIEI